MKRSSDQENRNQRLVHQRPEFEMRLIKCVLILCGISTVISLASNPVVLTILLAKKVFVSD
jgi:hypothetical protein